jgi:hypothetical protein
LSTLRRPGAPAIVWFGEMLDPRDLNPAVFGVLL